MFTLEALAEPGCDYKLQVHGRYAHSSDYVESALANAGLQVESFEKSVLRQELIEPVQGWVVVATPTTEHRRLADDVPESPGIPSAS